ncbi:MAG: efflux RND transporter periplasmic adaptor subunit [Bacteroidota bacterium]|nr:efflux RND transporter periplasmic adaptor subunit [Bacteroidota bacterium]
MKRKIIIAIPILVLLTGFAWYFLSKKASANGTNSYSFAEITRGNLETIISSSGTLEAVSTIDVGTQVSGTISKIFADFNDNVKKGQLLALLDTTNLAASVRDQNANLRRAKAVYAEAQAKYERDKLLNKKGFLSDVDFISSKTNLETAKSSLESAQSELKKAKTNLSYALIRSPIDGKIINRNIENGQTVAASFSTPTLFTIAANLSSMRILADVDESDIGQIHKGQKVRFTVQAYPDKKFYGTVDQIRLSPKSVQNVVNYVVVISARNDEQCLLPGMTATVDFFVQQKENVLLIPNSALKFQPTQEMLEALRSNMDSVPDSVEKRIKAFEKSNAPGGMAPPPGGGAPGGPGGGGPGTPPGMANGNSSNSSNFVTLWLFDKNGRIMMIPAMTGSTDGKVTEILPGRGIREGQKIIVSAKGTPISKDNMPKMNFGFGKKQS